ncbi:alpha/beta-Hydrolases superfamily protein [Striga hermonthica]|uniref:Alpha/beta-Hydrolases superfamily protein n=1 Tax=Striga hermonthica TaxID=68872 RepID=A0A9N7R1N4_STRHE|nr:alpha/beta-Hydrolases superfamily protein [Striga hermonthica]
MCMMASKLAYENDKVVKNIVDLHWKMHFVDFYNCWNDYQKENCTQVFIMCDKPKDANLILISFRGTEPFDADDWITDFDYSWYEIPKLGKVHMGFLEALGLGNRVEASTFYANLRANCNSKDNKPPKLNGYKELTPMGKRTAYYTVRSKLKDLLREHVNAKFVVTGHSLGGALAILFPTVLVLHEEEEIMKRLLGVYTFGQPRIGNRQLGTYMQARLEKPESKYFRVVYCNDLVPRLPYDNKTFLYKHFGECLYFNSLYVEKNVKEEPNKNYFGWRFLVPEFLNAVWELVRSFMMGYIYGPGYKECWESVMLRIVGLAIPGLSDHSPVDYVNSKNGNGRRPQGEVDETANRKFRSTSEVRSMSHTGGRHNHPTTENRRPVQPATSANVCDDRVRSKVRPNSALLHRHVRRRRRVLRSRRCLKAFVSGDATAAEPRCRNDRRVCKMNNESAT